MKPVDALQRMIEHSGMSANAVSLAMGRHRNFIASSIYQRSNPRSDTLIKVAEITGYKLMLQSDGDVIVLDLDGTETGD